MPQVNGMAGHLPVAALKEIELDSGFAVPDEDSLRADQSSDNGINHPHIEIFRITVIRCCMAVQCSELRFSADITLFEDRKKRGY